MTDSEGKGGQVSGSGAAVEVSQEGSGLDRRRAIAVGVLVAALAVASVSSGPVHVVLGIWVLVVPGIGLSSLLIGRIEPDGLTLAVMVVAMSVVALISLAVVYYVLGIPLSGWSVDIGADVIGAVGLSASYALDRRAAGGP